MSIQVKRSLMALMSRIIESFSKNVWLGTKNTSIKDSESKWEPLTTCSNTALLSGISFAFTWSLYSPTSSYAVFLNLSIKKRTSPTDWISVSHYKESWWIKMMTFWNIKISLMLLWVFTWWTFFLCIMNWPRLILNLNRLPYLFRVKLCLTMSDTFWLCPNQDKSLWFYLEIAIVFIFRSTSYTTSFGFACFLMEPDIKCFSKEIG